MRSFDRSTKRRGPFEMRTKDGALTPKQLKFVESYLERPNATAAAIAAGYSRQTARSIGSENLKKQAVKDAVEDGMNRTLAQLQIKRTDRRSWLLEDLIIAVNADIKYLFNRDGSFKPIHQWPIPFRTHLIKSITIRSIDEVIDGVKTTKNRIEKVEFISKEKFIKLLGKHRKIRAFVETEHDLAEEIEITKYIRIFESFKKVSVN